MGQDRASLPPEVRSRIEEAATKTATKKEEEAKAAQAGEGDKAPPARKPLLRRPRFWGGVAAMAAAVSVLVLGAEVRFSKRADHAVGYFENEKPRVAMATATAGASWGPPKQKSPVGQFVADPAAIQDAPSEQPALVGQGKGGRLAGDVQARGNTFSEVTDNPFLKPAQDPLSTFSIDVDTASYALVRSYLQGGGLPPPAAVRIEEMVNYFDYAYPPPEADVPFRVQLDLGVAPWAPEHKLVRIGIKGKEVKMSAMDGVNLVFLVDTSGSMSEPNKLPLLKRAFRMLVDKLGPNDRIAIVAYAGSAGLVLPSTPLSDKAAVLGAIDRLEAGGSTNGGAGIDLAYKVAAEHFLRGGVNRVLLATDGDFNVGTTSTDALVSLIQDKAKTGVFLSVLGFGMGNFNDALLEKIADKGNGQYAYIDNEVEAKRALVDGLGGLVTIAKDVKIQIEFNPAEVAAYRLIGYENRVMAARDFNDDRKDAGELGSGHTVTALYEVIPAGGAVPSGEPLKYQSPDASVGNKGDRGELLTAKLRYKEPDEGTSKLLEGVLKDRDVTLSGMSADFKFAAAVASFGMLLRRSPHAGSATLASVLALAEDGAGDDPKRREFLALVRKTKLAEAPRPTGSRGHCAKGDPLCEE
jgi:Ca-activated chloride channel family protein